MALSPELTMKIAGWRRAAVDGTLTVAQEKEIIETLRADRVQSHYASTTSRTKKAAAAAPVDTSALLRGLMGGAPPPGDEVPDTSVDGLETES